MKSLNILIEMIEKIITESEWGKHQDYFSLLKFLISEVNEFKEAIEIEDKINIAEELGDLLMLILFYMVLIEYDTDISKNELIENVCKKLEERYPTVFKEKAFQRTLFNTEEEDAAEVEKIEWYKQKDKTNVIKYCYCKNKSCSEYLEPGSPFIRLDKKTLICNKCNSKFDFRHTCLFPRTRTDRNKLLSLIYHKSKSNNHKIIADKLGVSENILKRALNISDEEAVVLSKIMSRRFGPRNKNLTKIPNRGEKG